MPVDFYNGADHATAHLLYARFFTRFFYKKGLVGDPEPFKKMYLHAKILAEDGTFFSKSKGNGIDPLEVIDSGYGADALRTYLSFIAPPDVESPWNSDGLPSCYRFINRVWTLVQEHQESKEQGAKSEVTEEFQGRALETLEGELQHSQELLRISHKAIKKVTNDIEQIKYNTAVSTMMEMVNNLYLIKAEYGFTDTENWQFALESVVQLMAPFAPHASEELWRDLGHEDSVHIGHWPELDEKYLVEDTITLAVQVNGKVRAEIEVSADASKEDIEAEALKQENVIAHLQNKKPTKVIYVPGRLVSIVV
jgi:leucyl-tRNA synthetase